MFTKFIVYELKFTTLEIYIYSDPTWCVTTDNDRLISTFNKIRIMCWLPNGKVPYGGSRRIDCGSLKVITAIEAELIPGLHPANERRRYKVAPSLIVWAQTDNQHWKCMYNLRKFWK